MGAAVNAAALQITRHRTKEDSKEEAMVVFVLCAFFGEQCMNNESVLRYILCHT